MRATNSRRAPSPVLNQRRPADHEGRLHRDSPTASPHFALDSTYYKVKVGAPTNE